MDMIVVSYHLFGYQVLIVPSHFLPFLFLLCFLTEQNKTDYFSSLNTFRKMYELIVQKHICHAHIHVGKDLKPFPIHSGGVVTTITNTINPKT